jgi:hypothetical protein
MSETFKCWCGDRVTDADFEPINGGCGGIGTLYCDCGGDFCVCHNHGEVQCDGCEDCDAGGFGEGDDGYDSDYEDRP